MAYDSIFGMGIEIDLRDGVSPVAANMIKSFMSVRQEAQGMVIDVDASFQRLQNLRFAGQDMMMIGEKMQGLGKSIITPFVDAGKQVLKMGDDFEKTRMTLEALYKSKDKAEEKMSWLMKYAAKTPFEIQELKGTMVGMKAIGIEADQMVTSMKGTRQEFIGFVGDLGALRPDLSLARIMQGVRNAMGGNIRSLDMILDIRSESILGRKFGTTKEQQIKDIADLTEALGAAGLMKKLSGTWSQMLSNLRDQTTRFFLSIADSGAFQSAKNTLQKVSDFFGKITDERMKKIGENIGKVFNEIWRPIDKVVTLLLKVADWIVNIAETNPQLLKLVATFTAFSGVSLIIGGKLLKTLGFLVIVFGMLGQSFLVFLAYKYPLLSTAEAMEKAMGKLAGTTRGLASSMFRFLGIATLALGAFLLIWKTNFLGIRTAITTFVTNVGISFKKAFSMMKMDYTSWVEARKNLIELDTVWGKFALKLANGFLTLKAIGEILGSNKLKADTFKKLRDSGLLPLIKTIWEFKMKFDAFWKGMKEGWRIISDLGVKALRTVRDWIIKVYNWFADVTGKSDEFNTSLSNSPVNLQLDKWEKWGKYLGIVFGYLVGKEIIWGIYGITSAVWGLVAAGFASQVAFWEFYAVVALVIGAGYLLYKAFKLFGDWWNDHWDNFIATCKELWAAFVQGVKDAIAVLQPLWNLVEKIWKRKHEPIIMEGTPGVNPNPVSPTAPTTPFTSGKNTSFFEKGLKGTPFMSTGGFTKTTGYAVLHPNEIVVNDPTTRKLTKFLADNTDGFRRNETKKTNNINSPITFEPGSIQIQMNGVSPQEIDNKFIETVAKKLQKRKEIINITKYAQSQGV